MKSAFFSLALILATNAAAKVTETTLKNGLKVIIKEDHRSPVMVSQIWYKVGSSYEHNGITGISHFLEHMMFKGTEKLKPNEFSKIISVNGGRENAFTGRDYTAYFQRMEKSLYPLSFELEAERMRNLKLEMEEFVKERSVVAEERRLRTDNNPQSLTFEKFAAAAYGNSPYNSPIIGWMTDIQNMQLEDLSAWYKKWYAPNNAILVVAGDVKPDRVILEAKKHFGKLKPSTITPPKPQKKIANSGSKNIKVKVPAKVPYIIIGYPAPTVANAKIKWEPYALELAAYILDGGRSSRIAKNLIRGSKIAASAGVGYAATARLQTMFLLDGTPAANHTTDEVKAALLAEIENLKTELVKPKELKRIKAQLMAAKVYERDSVFYQAMQIGKMEAMGLSWQLAENFVDELNKITPEQIQSVVKKYLLADKITTAVLIPEDKEAG